MIETVYKFQTLIAGFSALGAAVLTARYLYKQIKASVEEGKRDRDFRTEQHERERAFQINQHKIEMQTKRRAVAVMLESDIRSIDELTSLKLVVKIADEEAERLNNLGDAIPPVPFIFPTIDKSFLNNYSLYIENIPLMRVETVRAVSRFYLLATRLSKAIKITNATIKETALNETRRKFLKVVSVGATKTKSQIDLALRLLLQEAAIAEKELSQLKGILSNLKGVMDRLKGV